MPVFERGGNNTFAEIGDGFGDGANALFVFGREKKRTQERAMDAIAESEFCAAQSLEQIFRESGDTQKRSLRMSFHSLGGIARGYRRCRRRWSFCFES